MFGTVSMCAVTGAHALAAQVLQQLLPCTPSFGVGFDARALAGVVPEPLRMCCGKACYGSNRCLIFVHGQGAYVRDSQVISNRARAQWHTQQQQQQQWQ